MYLCLHICSYVLILIFFRWPPDGPGAGACLQGRTEFVRTEFEFEHQKSLGGAAACRAGTRLLACAWAHTIAMIIVASRKEWTSS